MNTINDIENKLAIRIPDEIQGILTSERNISERKVFIFKESGRITSSNLRYFYKLNSIEDYDNINIVLENLKIKNKRMPSHILPFGEDPYGNQICISCAGEDYGHIYFWDHEKEVDYTVSDDSDYSNLYLISNSFQEFLDGLMTHVEYIDRYMDKEKGEEIKKQLGLI